MLFESRLAIKLLARLRTLLPLLPTSWSRTPKERMVRSTGVCLLFPQKFIDRDEYVPNLDHSTS